MCYCRTTEREDLQHPNWSSIFIWYQRKQTNKRWKIMQTQPPDLCPRTSSDCKERSAIKIHSVHSGFQYCLFTWTMLRLGCSSRLGHLPLGVNTCTVSAPIVMNRAWVYTVGGASEVVLFPETAGSPYTLHVSQDSRGILDAYPVFICISRKAQLPISPVPYLSPLWL